MVTIPLYYILTPYGIFLIVFFTFFLINFFHIILTGTTTLGSFIVTFIIIAATVLTLYGTWYYLRTVDWQQPLISLDLKFISNILHPGTANSGPIF